jgi:hypothetical protein
MFVVVISHREGMDVTEPHRGARLSRRLLPRAGAARCPFHKYQYAIPNRKTATIGARTIASAIMVSLSSLGIDWQRLVLAAMADTAAGHCGRPVADPTGFRVFGAARRAEYRAVLLI